MPVIYDAKRPGLAMLRWEGTLWQTILIDPMFWVFIAINVTFSVLRMTDTLPAEEAPQIPHDSLIIVSSLVAFGIVFFLNTVMNRFQQQVNLLLGLGGSIFNLVSLCAARFKSPDYSDKQIKDRLDEISRLANSLNHICFYSIGHLSNYEYLVFAKMLTKEEVHVLEQFEGKKTNLLAAWILDALEKAYSDKMLHRPKMCNELVFQIRGNAALLQDLQRFPIPLGYYHFTTISLYSYLLLLAYATPYMTDDDFINGTWMSCFCYLVILMAFMGVNAVANAHADPYGEDASDIDVVHEINGVSRQCKALIQQKFHPSYSSWSTRNNHATTHFSEVPVREATVSNTYVNPKCYTALPRPLKRLVNFIDARHKNELQNIVLDRHNVDDIVQDIVTNEDAIPVKPHETIGPRNTMKKIDENVNGLRPSGPSALPVSKSDNFIGYRRSSLSFENIDMKEKM